MVDGSGRQGESSGGRKGGGGVSKSRGGKERDKSFWLGGGLVPLVRKEERKPVLKREKREGDTEKV